MSDVLLHFTNEFVRLERLAPEQRARLFNEIERRWCWDCGLDQMECEGHAHHGFVAEQEERIRTLAREEIARSGRAG